MPLPCSICTHTQCHAIDEALVLGEAAPAIAAQFEASVDALQRHKHKHLAALLAEAGNAESLRAEALVEQVWRLQEDTLSALAEAREGGNLRIFFAGVREARGNAELLARLAGMLGGQEIGPRTVQQQQVIVRFDQASAPDYLRQPGTPWQSPLPALPLGGELEEAREA